MKKKLSVITLLVALAFMVAGCGDLSGQMKKWNESSSQSSDSATYDTMYENVQLALADDEVLVAVKNYGGDIVIEIGEDGVTLNGPNELEKKLEEVCGEGYKKNVRVHSVPESGNYRIIIQTSDEIGGGLGISIKRDREPGFTNGQSENN